MFLLVTQFFLLHNHKTTSAERKFFRAVKKFHKLCWTNRTLFAYFSLSWILIKGANELIRNSFLSIRAFHCWASKLEVLTWIIHARMRMRSFRDSIDFLGWTNGFGFPDVLSVLCYCLVAGQKMFGLWYLTLGIKDYWWVEGIQFIKTIHSKHHFSSSICFKFTNIVRNGCQELGFSAFSYFLLCSIFHYIFPRFSCSPARRPPLQLQTTRGEHKQMMMMWKEEWFPFKLQIDCPRDTGWKLNQSEECRMGEKSENYQVFFFAFLWKKPTLPASLSLVWKFLVYF